MNPPPTIGLWLQTLGLLAAQSALLLAVAGLSQGMARAPQSRRRVWLATLAGVALLLANSLAGLDRSLARHFAAGAPSAPAVIVRGNLPVTSAPTGADASETSLRSAAATDAGLSSDLPSTPVGTSWPAWLWLAGAAAIGLWSLAPRIWLACAGRHAPAAESPEFQRRMQSLAGRLNIRRRVRVVCLPRLAGPVAFGMVRPSIGLPADFWTAHSAIEQDAMLSHELAHLAARDPLWLALANGLAALLWWHPLVWWGRRQLRAACESAADEASLVVEDGPAVLAGCLVALASRWQQRGVLGLLGMAGFRSGLGRRVERLLHLRGRDQPALRRRWPGVVASMFAVATLALVVVAPARLFPVQAANRPALIEVVGDALAQATVSSAAPTRATGNPPGAAAAQPETKSTAASGAIATPPTEPVHLVSLLLSKDGQLMLDRREQTLESLQSELRSLQSASSLVVRVSAPETVAAARVIEVMNACRAAGVTRISLVSPAEDEETVEQLMQVLNTAQPQVMIEAKFVEVSADANAPLGLDWHLGSVQAGTNQPPGIAPTGAYGFFPGPGVPSASSSTGHVATMTGLRADPQFREVIAASSKAGTNGVRELRGDQLPWAGRDATNAANIRVTAAQGATVTGILTDPQSRAVLRALEQRAGVDVLSAPRVVTVSGRQAQIQVAELRSVATGINPDAVRVPGGIPATNALPFTSATVPTGPSLDVIPVVSADGVTINLTAIPTVTEFLGYDEPPKDSKVEVMVNGKARLVALPLPRFRVRQMVTQAAIRDGQTLVLGGFPVEETRLSKEKVPVLGAIPLAGALFRSESKSTVRKQLLVFVTATIIDSAGNRVNASADTPAPARTAPQFPGEAPAPQSEHGTPSRSLH